MGTQYLEADSLTVEEIVSKWKWVRAEWLHVEGGFTEVAKVGEEIVGFISVRWRDLPPPLKNLSEGFIDIIDVDARYRRQGIARELLTRAERRCREHRACQISAWSSDDKKEAIPMWYELGFGLCPATDYPQGQPVKGYFVAKRIDG